MTEAQETVSAWLEAVGRETGHTLGLGDDGQCNIKFGADLNCMVEVPDDSELFFLYVPLVRAPEDEATRCIVFAAALEMNMFSLNTGGATVSFDRRTGYVVLTFAQKVSNVTEELFKAVLGDLLDLGTDLHEKLQYADAASGSDDEGALAPVGMRV